MKFLNILPAILAIAALSSCSVYREGQTPDDVYYSPGPTVEDSYVTVENNKRGSSYGRYDNTNPEDNYLRMRRSGSRWSTFDDYAYMNDWQYNGGYYGMYSPYSYGGFYGSPYTPYAYGGFGFYNPWAYNPWSFGSYWNSYYNWNSFYNPYCPGFIVGSPKNNPVVYRSVRNFNMASYNNNNYYNRSNNSTRRNTYYSTPNNGRTSTRGSYYTNENQGSNGLRRVYPRRSNDSYYSPQSQSNSRPSYSPPPSSAPVRSYSPSSGGSSGGGGGRPSRGGR